MSYILIMCAETVGKWQNGPKLYRYSGTRRQRHWTRQPDSRIDPADEPTPSKFGPCLLNRTSSRKLHYNRDTATTRRPGRPEITICTHRPGAYPTGCKWWSSWTRGHMRGMPSPSYAHLGHEKKKSKSKTRHYATSVTSSVATAISITIINMVFSLLITT